MYNNMEYYATLCNLQRRYRLCHIQLCLNPWSCYSVLCYIGIQLNSMHIIVSVTVIGFFCSLFVFVMVFAIVHA